MNRDDTLAKINKEYDSLMKQQQEQREKAKQIKQKFCEHQTFHEAGGSVFCDNCEASLCLSYHCNNIAKENENYCHIHHQIK